MYLPSNRSRFAAAVVTLVASVQAQPAGVEFFETRIRPVLVKQCFACHSKALKTPMGGLALDSKSGTAHVVVAGKPDESKLLSAIRHSENVPKMPPGGKLGDDVIADFAKWIADGAADPRTDTVASLVKGPRVVGDADIATGRKWWAFQPLREIAPPATPSSSRVRRKIDSFVLAKLSEAKLIMSDEADERTLFIRANLDVLGLRPAFAEVEAYAQDPSRDKYERLIDRLLDSPRYGERWARYWLDVARYAEDNVGNITNPPYPHAWRYRDWVIEALNRDVPYDRFVSLQLAADLMPDVSRADLRALGYLGLGPIDHKDVRLSVEVLGTLQLNDIDERVDSVGRGLLGLTIACARCHDHKFDPIRSSDYYRMAGIFASTQRATRPNFPMDPAGETRFMWLYQRLFDLNYTASLLDSDPGSKPEQAKRQVAKFRDEIATRQSELAALAGRYPALGPYMASVPYPGERDASGKRVEKTIDPAAEFTNSVYDAGGWPDSSEPDLTFFDYRPGQPRDLPLYRGGNISAPGATVQRGFPAVLAHTDGVFRNGSGRLELARGMFGDASPLTARVIVNRVWGWHFGKPLVATPSDFGTQGERPTHEDLLTDLAARFVAKGWSLKWLHREILLSSAYRQSSRPRADAEATDPANRLLWRMSPRRLDIEAYRDSMLSASGDLDLRVGGLSDDLESSRRRTIYARISRTRLNDLLKLYDVPEPIVHSPERSLTISPTQQLFVMNSNFLRERAASLARKAEAEIDDALRVRLLYRLALSRDPSASESELAIGYLRQANMTHLAQALLETNEVMFWP